MMDENADRKGTTQTAHKISKKQRTEDVKINENVTFSSLWLSPEVLDGLSNSGFERPSPIQLRAIPIGRCGLDLIVQAKSGTGKTCVFAVVALESIMITSPGTQVVVLAPTREIALQIWEVIRSLSCAMPALQCYTFIGGIDLRTDKQNLKRCHIAIGTPGRIKQLIEEKLLRPESIRLFVLDEADKLMESGFQEQINWIYSALPENKQMLALSATYPEVLAQHLTTYMRNPTFVRLNTSDPALLGIRQYYQEVEYHPLPQLMFDYKVTALVELLMSVTFSQCLVFSNFQMRAQSLCNVLNSKGWPATYISGNQEQQDRIAAMNKLKTLQCRVLVSTDLTSRGIDAENVNFVVNLDIPFEHETYLHRIGRAGRFGTYGAGVTLAAKGKEVQELKNIERKCNTTIKPLPDPIPEDLAKSSGYVDISDLVTTEKLCTRDDQDNLIYSTPTKQATQNESSIIENEGSVTKTSGSLKSDSGNGFFELNSVTNENYCGGNTKSTEDDVFVSDNKTGNSSPTFLSDSDDGLEVNDGSSPPANQAQKEHLKTPCKLCLEEEKKKRHYQYDAATLYEIGETVKSRGVVHPALINNNEVEFILLRNVTGRQRKSSKHSKKSKHSSADSSKESTKSDVGGGNSIEVSDKSGSVTQQPKLLHPTVSSESSQAVKLAVDEKLAVDSKLNADAKSWAELCDTSVESAEIEPSPDKVDLKEQSNSHCPQTPVITYDFETLYAIRDIILAAGVVHPALVGNRDLQCIVRKGAYNNKLYGSTSLGPGMTEQRSQKSGGNEREKSEPSICGGSQDMNSISVPSRTSVKMTKSCPDHPTVSSLATDTSIPEKKMVRKRRRSRNQRQKNVVSYEDAVKDMNNFMRSEKKDPNLDKTATEKSESHSSIMNSKNKSGGKDFKNLKSHVAEILSSASSPDFGMHTDSKDSQYEAISQNFRQDIVEKDVQQDGSIKASVPDNPKSNLDADASPVSVQKNELETKDNEPDKVAVHVPVDSGKFQQKATQDEDSEMHVPNDYNYEEALKFVQYIPGGSSVSQSGSEDIVLSPDSTSPPVVSQEPLPTESNEQIDMPNDECIPDVQPCYPSTEWLPVSEDPMLDMPYTATDVLSSVNATVMEFPAPGPLQQPQTLSDYAQAQQEVHKWVFEGFQPDSVPLDNVPFEGAMLDDYDRSFLHFHQTDLGELVDTTAVDELSANGCVIQQSQEHESACIAESFPVEVSSSCCESNVKSSQPKHRRRWRQKTRQGNVIKNNKQTKNTADQRQNRDSRIPDRMDRGCLQCEEAEASLTSESHSCRSHESEQCKSKSDVTGPCPADFMFGNPSWWQSFQAQSTRSASLSDLEQVYYQNYIAHCYWAQYYHNLLKNSKRQKSYTQRFDAQKHYIKNMANYWAKQSHKH